MKQATIAVHFGLRFMDAFFLMLVLGVFHHHIHAVPALGYWLVYLGLFALSIIGTAAGFKKDVE